MTGAGAAERTSRRRFLAAAGVGIVGALAGCGYRPGGGDLAWESSFGGGLLRAGDRWLLPAGDRLFVVRNRSGRTFDFEDDTWRDVENAAVTALDPAGDRRLDAETERRATGLPAVTETSVVVPVEGGRLTAIDRERAAFDPNDPTTNGADDTAGDEPTAIRWQVDVSPADRDTTERDREPTASAVRAGDRLAAAVIGGDVVAVDVEAGERTFDLATVWPADAGREIRSIAPDRVAVDGDDLWVAVEGPDGESGSDGDAVLARFDPTGERRVTRSFPTDIDWLRVVDGTVVVGTADAESVGGFDRDLDRRFTVDAWVPPERPPAVEGKREDGGSTEGGGSRVYLRRGETVRALDVAAGEIAWEHDGLPASRAFAADERGIYAVGRRAAREAGRRTGPEVVAVAADGTVRWSAPLPEDVRVEELFAVGDRLIVVDGDDLYGFRAAPGERWSLIG